MEHPRTFGGKEEENAAKVCPVVGGLGVGSGSDASLFQHSHRHSVFCIGMTLAKHKITTTTKGKYWGLKKLAIDQTSGSRLGQARGKRMASHG